MSEQNGTQAVTREPSALRVGDEERRQTVAALQQHFVAGRLTEAELGDRARQALAARTQGELAAVLSDLPDAPGSAPHREGPERPAHLLESRSGQDRDDRLRRHAGVYLGVMVLLVAIWLMTTPGGYFWPMWPMLGWGVMVVVHGSLRKSGRRGRAG